MQKQKQVDEAVVLAKSLFVTTIVGQLRFVLASLKEYNKQISTLLSNFSDSDRFRSLPLVDTILAGKLLVFIGTDRERFSSAFQLQSYFGTAKNNAVSLPLSVAKGRSRPLSFACLRLSAPYTKSSGKHRGVHFRLSCNKTMRTALTQMAFASLRKSALKRAIMFANVTKERRCIIAISSMTLLKVIFAIWQNKTMTK